MPVRSPAHAWSIDELLAAMDAFSFFAPAHNPPYIAAMKAFRDALPGVRWSRSSRPFPTHRWMRRRRPTRCRTSGAPSSAFAATGSTARAIARPARMCASSSTSRRPAPHLLPSGRKLQHCGLPRWSSIDASFGTSPQSGLPQNNRVGDIDAFAVLLHDEEAGPWPRTRWRAFSGQPVRPGRASAAPAATCATWKRRRRRAAMGAACAGRVCARHPPLSRGFMPELDGVDAVSFSRGIGGNRRERAARSTEIWPPCVEIDEAVNRAARTAQVISSKTSAAKVLIIPADEESMVARDTSASWSNREIGTGRRRLVNGNHD